MNTQKLFLFIAIFLTIFLLWDKWELTQSIDENGNIVTQTAIVGIDTPSAENDVPLAAEVPVAENTFTEVSTPVMEESNISGAYTTVVTDLLTVQISNKGGTIISAFLNDYPTELYSDQTFELLSNSPESIFHAQSGLIPADQMPTHQSEFASERQEYFLQNNSELIVPLSWKGDNGIEVTKYFYFKPDSYIIEVDYQIRNNSLTDQNVSSYTQLAHGAIIESSGMAMGMQNFSGGATYNDEEVFEKIDFEDFDSTPKTSSIGGWAAMIQHLPKRSLACHRSRRHRHRHHPHRRRRHRRRRRRRLLDQRRPLLRRRSCNRRPCRRRSLLRPCQQRHSTSAAWYPPGPTVTGTLAAPPPSSRVPAGRRVAGVAARRRSHSHMSVRA